MSTRTGQQSVRSQSTETAGAESFSLSSLGVHFVRFQPWRRPINNLLGGFCYSWGTKWQEDKGVLGFAYL